MNKKIKAELCILKHLRTVIKGREKLKMNLDNGRYTTNTPLSVWGLRYNFISQTRLAWAIGCIEGYLESLDKDVTRFDWTAADNVEELIDYIDLCIMQCFEHLTEN